MRDLFEDTPEGRRRGVFFAIGVATGFLSIVAATSALVVSSGNATIAGVLILLGSGAFSFALLIARGRFGWLVGTDEKPRDEDRIDEEPASGEP